MLRPPLLATLLTLPLWACGEKEPENEPREAVTIQFEALAGQSPVRCGTELIGLGTGPSTLSIADFRFYVHDLHLLTDEGDAVPLALDQDGQWQYANLAILDFEDGTGPCSNGTSALNSVVRGHVPPGNYSGLRFTLGVPFELNHIDASTAPAPLNLTAMFWSWNGGYKFLRLDAATPTNPGFRIHLGSTGCAPAPGGGVNQCLRPNRREIVFETFDHANDVVIADLAELLNGIDLDHIPDQGAPGCMSDPGDEGCARVFENLGIDENDQRFFRRK